MLSDTWISGFFYTLLFIFYHLLTFAPDSFFFKPPICYFLLSSVLFSWAIFPTPLFKLFYKYHNKNFKGRGGKKKSMFVIPGLTRTIHSFINKLWRINRWMIYINGNWHILYVCLLTRLSHWKYIWSNPKH